MMGLLPLSEEEIPEQKKIKIFLKMVEKSHIRFQVSCSLLLSRVFLVCLVSTSEYMTQVDSFSRYGFFSLH